MDLLSQIFNINITPCTASPRCLEKKQSKEKPLLFLANHPRYHELLSYVNGLACQHVTKRGAHWSEQTKPQNNGKGMYVGLKQPRRGGELAELRPEWLRGRLSTGVTLRVCFWKYTLRASSSSVSPKIIININISYASRG